MPPTSNRPNGFEREQGPGGLEVRARAAATGELRADGDDGAPLLVGYGSVFNQRATIGGFFSEWDEEVAPGAWAKSIAEGDIRSMFNHKAEKLLGRTKGGSLRLSEDDEGLLYEVDIDPDVSHAMDVYSMVKRGDVDGSSVWFRVIREEWTEPTDDNGLERSLRRITEAILFETGPVVFPAFEQTSVSARAMDVLDGVLRTAGVAKSTKRARLASDLLANPALAEDELRSLLAQAPALRDAVCACTHEGRAADEAPGNGTPSGNGHLPPTDFYLMRARATASRGGLALIESEST